MSSCVELLLVVVLLEVEVLVVVELEEVVEVLLVGQGTFQSMI